MCVCQKRLIEKKAYMISIHDIQSVMHRIKKGERKRAFTAVIYLEITGRLTARNKTLSNQCKFNTIMLQL